MINKNANVGKDGKDNFNKDKLNKFLSISKKKTDFLPIVDKKNFLTDILIFDNQNYHNNFACFILAGGRGERLKPLSNKIPKPLIKIKNKSLIEIIILKLSKINIMKFYISVNYKKNLIINALSQNKYKNLNINFVSEKLKLGTAGSLSLIKNTESENILIFNSDILTDLDITKLINFYQENNFDFLIGAATINYSIPFGVIEDIDGKVLEISEKPNKQYKILSGIYILKIC